MTGIKDVARELGVSTATVSRALRGLPRVSPETRDRVLEVANRMGYVASPHAASLASGQTLAIGVVVPNVTRWFFGSVVHGAEELLRQEGYDLLLYTVTGEPAARQRLFHSYLLSKRVDAVMVLALRPTSEEVASLDGQAPPSWWSAEPCPVGRSVRIDDVEAAEALLLAISSGSGTPASPTSAASPTPSTLAWTSRPPENGCSATGWQWRWRACGSSPVGRSPATSPCLVA